MLSVPTGAAVSTDSPPTVGRDPVVTLSAMTVAASTTAAGADISVADIMDFSRGNIKFVRDQTVLSDLT